MAGGRDDQLSPDGDRWRIELAEWCLSDAETSAVIKPGTQCEIDGDVWTIPAERMKAKAAHRVLLSIRALQVLVEARSLSGGDGVVFPSPATGRSPTNEAFSKLLRELGIDGTAHGMRTAFGSWAAEQGVSREVAEGCLAMSPRTHKAPISVRTCMRPAQRSWTDRAATSAAWVLDDTSAQPSPGVASCRRSHLKGS